MGGGKPRMGIFTLVIGAFYLGCVFGNGVDSTLPKRLVGGGAAPKNVIVSFNQSISAVFEKIEQMNFTNIAEKRSVLTLAQQEFTEEAQKDLKRFLTAQGAQSESLWITNKMFVPNASPILIQAIENFQGVSKVEEEKVIKIQQFSFSGQPSSSSLANNHSRSERQSSSSTWGIRKIKADRVWGSYQGQGVVVGHIDTGVRGTHESLRDNWRQSYGWYDPVKGTSTPNDQDGHGTHTMGTIAGKNGIGVAPRATWISCKGCRDVNFCGESTLVRCGQWIQCPTRPDGNNRDCKRAPQIVSNSWGWGRNNDFYDDVIRSWKNSGIIPVFANMNEGPDCETAGSPGDRSGVIAVGNLDSRDRIARDSSLGPATDGSGRIKPDISAPGSDINSAWFDGDSSYKSLWGTSMACPHVVGVIALMKEKRPSLSYNQIYNAITRNAVTNLDTSTAKTCGGRSGSSFPNNVFGYGRIDAVDCVGAI